MKQFFWLLASTCILNSPGRTQTFDFVRVINPFPVREQSSKNLPFPFLGGFNTPRPQFVDIDNDGDFDLFVQEENRTPNQPGRLIYFENIGTPASFEFQWVTDWYKHIDIGGWYKFVDLDADGDQDLFTEGSFSIMRYYRNEGSAGAPLFVERVDSLRDADGELIFMDISSLPELGDVDCDGDFDLFIGRQTGRITFYENPGLGQNDLPRFEFRTDEFQDILVIGEGGGAPTQFVQQQYRAENHGANALTVVDIDQDGIPDMFWGDIFEPSLVFLENTGGCTNPNIGIATRRFPAGQPLLTSGYNVSRFADIDGDGDADMFVGVLGGAFSPTKDLSENFYFLENSGASPQPEFTLRTRELISTLDIGANSTAAFVDIDADGDQDLFLANEADPNEAQRSRLYFYENQGTPASPALQLIDDDYLNLNIGFNYAPAFVDIDADGDQDLFIGEWDGQLNFVENRGSATHAEFGAVQQNYARIDIGNNNMPAFADIDADGDFDLFIGEFLGNINFFENVGSPEAPMFAQGSAPYFGIDVGQYSSPEFADLDRDGDFDLWVGSENAGIEYFQNTGSSQSANFAPDTTFNLQVMARSVPALADIDSDTDLDFFAGGVRGGLIFYENQEFTPDPEEPPLPEGFVLRQNYPNPFNPETVIEYAFEVEQEQVGQLHTLVIFNILGEKIREWKFTNNGSGVRNAVTWDGRNQAGRQMPSGVYFYRLTAADQSATRKMLLIH